MGNFCSCYEELLVEDELPPIVFFDLEDLKNMGTTPRSPEDKHLHRKYDDIDKDNSVFIFISHCWKRGYKGAPGYDGRPHPDTPNDDKLKLTIQACEKWKKSLFPNMEKVYLWIDYGCIDQDASACLELKMLDKIIQVCDIVLTPIYENPVGNWDDEIRRKGVSNMFEQYGSPDWNQGEHSYLRRAWCRVEMMYATNLPLLERSEERKSKLAPILRQRRIHAIYGSNEEKRNAPPVILPPMNNSWFDKYPPREGNLSKETDRKHVVKLEDNIRPSIKRTEEKYEGDRNEAGQMHGKGTYTYANGNLYEGDFVEDKVHGKGTFTYANGNVYEGDWVEDNMHGKGTYTSADGSIAHNGEWRNDEPFGKSFPSLTGRMSKEGHLIRNWKQRLFQLEYGTLTYIDESTQKIQGSVYLKGYTVTLEQPSTKGRPSPGIRLRSKNPSSKDLNLRFEDEQDRERWAQAFRDSIQACDSIV